MLEARPAEKAGLAFFMPANLKGEINLSGPTLDYGYFDGYKFQGAHYQISKTMLNDGSALGLKLDEVILYTILRDRAKLSYQNRKIDKDGHIYIFYTRESAASYLRWSVRKTSNIFRALVQHGLLEEVRHSPQGAKKLYVRLWSDSSLNTMTANPDTKQFPYMTATNINVPFGHYYILPKVLLEEEQYHDLSLRAVLLYAIILDRLLMSIRYGQIDDRGIPWTTIDTKAAQTELQCSPHTLSRVCKELDIVGLLERKRANVTQPWRIYARNFITIPDSAVPKLPAQDADPAALNCQNCASESPNFPVSNNSINNNPINNLSMHQDILRENNAYEEAYNLVHYDDTLSLIYSRLDSETLASAITVLDLCLSIVEQDLSSETPYILVGGTPVEVKQVLMQYKKLTPSILYIVISKTVELYPKIKNPEAYIRRVLCSASEQHTSEAYFFERSSYGH